MSFFRSADAYDAFMGRYSGPLAPVFADLAGVAPGQRVVDVGCGTGALTAELVRRAGPAQVAAADPAEAFVAAARDRHPDVGLAVAGAEELPWRDASFDAALAQLVVHVMADPAAGLAEMSRVTRPGGVVAACVWDFEEGGSPLTLFWQAARDVDPAAPAQDERPGTRRGQLGRLLREAALVDVEESTLTVSVEHEGFEQWWEPFSFAFGPAGAYLAGLDAERRALVEQRCRELLPDGPFTVTGRAWAARGRVRAREGVLAG